MRIPQDRILHIGTEIVDGKVNVTVEWQGELVRCKDCRWYKPKYKDKEYDCPQGLYAVYADDYCSHGERRKP